MSVIGRLQKAGFEVLTREEWGSRFESLYQERRDTRPFNLPAKHFFAHVTVTEDTGIFTGDFKTDVRTVEGIGYARFGTGISYTWIVDQRSGLIAQGHPLDACGAHTLNDKDVPGFPYNLNAEGHAIAWIAVPGDRPSQRCLNSYSAIIAAEKAEGKAQKDAKIYPHSKFAAKDCPLESLRKHLDEIMRKSRTILEDEQMPLQPEEYDKIRDVLLNSNIGEKGSVETLRGRIRGADEGIERVEREIGEWKERWDLALKREVQRDQNQKERDQKIISLLTEIRDKLNVGSES